MPIFFIFATIKTQIFSYKKHFICLAVALNGLVLCRYVQVSACVCMCIYEVAHLGNMKIGYKAKILLHPYRFYYFS